MFKNRLWEAWGGEEGDKKGDQESKARNPGMKGCREGAQMVQEARKNEKKRAPGSKGTLRRSKFRAIGSAWGGRGGILPPLGRGKEGSWEAPAEDLTRPLAYGQANFCFCSPTNQQAVTFEKKQKFRNLNGIRNMAGNQNE